MNIGIGVQLLLKQLLLFPNTVRFWDILNINSFVSDTPEQAAMTVKQLRATPFPRFGEPLQIMFSLPQYGAPVLLKSFEIFHNEVTFCC